MNKKNILKLAAIILLVCIPSCGNNNTAAPVPNTDVISYQSFSINADSSNPDSWIQGTVFVLGGNGVVKGNKVQIISSVNIDKNDWAGVNIEIPKDWRVTSVISDYPQGKTNPDTYAVVLHTETDTKYNTAIRIGFTKDIPNLTRGGKGNFTILLEYEKSLSKLSDTLTINIGIGSQGDTIMYPFFQTITVPLTK